MSKNVAHKAIYKPEGAAREYSVWGCNLYKGCSHQCSYCYLRRGPMGKQLGGCVPEIEQKVGGTEEKALRRFKMEVDAYQDQFIADGGIFFSFSTDPMLRQTIDLTSMCAIYAMSKGVPVYILTKAAWWVTDNFYIKQFFPYRELLHVGFTLTGHDELEPLAASNVRRQSAMVMLKAMHFDTFASMEPVIDFESTLAIIETLKDSCPEFRIGMLSPYSPKRYDWNQCHRFIDRVAFLSSQHGFRVIWKESINRFYREQKPK